MEFRYNKKDIDFYEEYNDKKLRSIIIKYKKQYRNAKTQKEVDFLENQIACVNYVLVSKKI